AQSGGDEQIRAHDAQRGNDEQPEQEQEARSGQLQHQLRHARFVSALGNFGLGNFGLGNFRLGRVVVNGISYAAVTRESLNPQPWVRKTRRDCPTRTTSPSTSCEVCTGVPLTVVPLVDPRSASRAVRPSQVISRCRRDTPVSGSRNWASWPRPTTMVPSVRW